MDDVEKLTVLLTQLGDGVRKRFDKSGPLTIEDMVKIITPPPHPLLIRGGGFHFSPMYDASSMTYDNGSVISDTCFIDPIFYVQSSKKEFQTLANKHSLIIRAHFKYVSGDNISLVSWCFDGMDTNAKWNPSGSSVSDLYVGRFTPDFGTTYLYFSGNDVKIDLSQTYFEIISSN